MLTCYIDIFAHDKLELDKLCISTVIFKPAHLYFYEFYARLAN